MHAWTTAEHLGRQIHLWIFFFYIVELIRLPQHAYIDGIPSLAAFAANACVPDTRTWLCLSAGRLQRRCLQSAESRRHIAITVFHQSFWAEAAAVVAFQHVRSRANDWCRESGEGWTVYMSMSCCRTIIHMFTCVLSTSKYNMWRLTVFTLVDVHDSSDSATRLPIVGLGFNFLSLFLLHAFHDSDELCTKHLLLERVCVCVCLCSYSSVLGVGSCHTTIRCFPSAFVKINMRITNEE